MPLDERFAFNTKDSFKMGTNVFLKENLLYEPNRQLLDEINNPQDYKKRSMFGINHRQTNSTSPKVRSSSAKRSLRSRSHSSDKKEGTAPIEYKISPEK
jgi:hypothetical protein